MSQTKEDLLRKIAAVNVWRKAGVRAPHKPLLILLGLALYQQGKKSNVLFVDIEDQLRALLTEYGPPRTHVHPEYPFWRLQHDGLWEIETDRDMQSRQGHDDPRVTELRSSKARGFFPEWIIRLLDRHEDLTRDIVARVLTAHFPSEIHSRIIGDLKLPSTVIDPDRHQSEATFKSEVLQAYAQTCALSGFALRHAQSTYGVDAAYIRWPQSGGPNRVSNGIAMTSLHAELFARGIITIEPDYTVRLLDTAELTSTARDILLRSSDHKITLPVHKEDWPDPRFLRWHNKEVFRGAPVTI